MQSKAEVSVDAMVGLSIQSSMSSAARGSAGSECPSARLRDGKYDLDSALGLARMEETKSPLSPNCKFEASALLEEAKIMAFLTTEKVHRVDVSQFIKDTVQFSVQSKTTVSLAESPCVSVKTWPMKFDDK